MQTQNIDSVNTRGQREKEALRQMWEAIAWISAALAVADFFLWYPGWDQDTGTILLFAFIGITAFACWNLRGTLGESISTNVGMRLGVFSSVFLVLLLLIPILAFGFFFLKGIVLFFLGVDT